MPKHPKFEPVQGEYFSWTITTRDGVYYANRQNAGGYRQRITLSTRDWDEAQENLQELDRYTAMEQGLITEAQARDQSNRLSIEEGWKLYDQYCDRGQVQGGVSQATLKRYRAVRDHHMKFCEEKSIRSWNDFSKHHLRDYGKEREKVAEAAYRTVYLEMTTIKGVNSWLISEEHLPESTRIHLKLSKPQGSDTYCYTREQVSAMIAKCRETNGLDWLGDVIVALAHTGMRISELVDLRWEDIHFESQTIRVADERSSQTKSKAGTARTTKGKRSRSIPMHPRVAELLRSKSRAADGYIFRADRGGRLRARVVLDRLINLVILPLAPRFPTPTGEIGFERGRLHSFRHFFCSQAFLGGASEGEIRDWLGHAESKMVEHYRHLRSEESVRRMQSLNFLDVADGQQAEAPDEKDK